MREQTRAAAVVLHRELVAFRRTLRAELGASHLDYQNLRAHVGFTGVEEAEEEVEETVDPLAKTSEAPVISTNGARNNRILPESVIA